MSGSYRDLVVWQKSMDLAAEVYKLCKLLPVEEQYGLRSQMQRAAVSIPSNIAEDMAATEKVSKSSSCSSQTDPVQNYRLNY